MKVKGKDPFRNRAIAIFVYNPGELRNSPNYQVRKEQLRQKAYDDGKVIETLSVKNFRQIFKARFGEIKEAGAHKDVIKDSCKIYYYDDPPIRNSADAKAWVTAQHCGKRTMRTNTMRY